MNTEMIFIFLLAGAALAYILVPLSKTARYVAAAGLVGFFILLIWPSTYKNYRLEKGGYHIAGTLLSKNCDPKKSQRIEYQFHIDSKEFRGVGKPGGGNKSCENFQIGDRVFITYLAKDPSINVPEREVSSDTYIGILLSFGMFGGLVWANQAQSRFRQQKAKSGLNA